MMIRVFALFVIGMLNAMHLLYEVGVFEQASRIKVRFFHFHIVLTLLKE